MAGLCLCALFLLIYPGGELCRLFEYTLVILCFAFACGHRSETLDGLLSLLALLCTAGADFFLVALKEEQWLPGLSLFCVAQLFWALRLLRMEAGRRRFVHGLTWALTCGTLLVVAVIAVRGGDPVLLLSAVYASLLLTTVLFSWLTPRNLLFTLEQRCPVSGFGRLPSAQNAVRHPLQHDVGLLRPQPDAVGPLQRRGWGRAVIFRGGLLPFLHQKGILFSINT